MALQHGLDWRTGGLEEGFLRRQRNRHHDQSRRSQCQCRPGLAGQPVRRRRRLRAADHVRAQQRFADQVLRGRIPACAAGVLFARSVEDHFDQGLERQEDRRGPERASADPGAPETQRSGVRRYSVRSPVASDEILASWSRLSPAHLVTADNSSSDAFRTSGCRVAKSLLAR